jgi:ABC-2 type transport system permease protein
MVRSVFTATLHDRLRATVLFGIGVAAVTSMYVSVFPSFQDQMAGYAEAMPEALAAFMGSDFVSPAGYLHSTIFTILGPVLFVAAAVTFGAAAIAGEEENRTLPVLLSVPVSRVGMTLQKLGAITLALTALALVLFAMLVGLVSAFDIDLAAGRLLAATVHLHALTLLAASLAFAIGAAFGRKAIALGVAAGVVVLGFVIDGVAGMVDGLGALQWLSPFYWYAGTEPVRNGIAWGWLALLYAVAAAVAAVGIWRFDRRDLT